jgi:NAD+ synthase
MDYARLADDIVDWMRAMLHQAGAVGFVVGLSGGVDSAATAALCARAAGDEVLGVWMPCHSIPEDEMYSRMAADALDIRLQTVDLCAVYDAFMTALGGPAPLESHCRQNGLPGAQGESAQAIARHHLSRANLKPRLRMSALYYLAQTHGYLVAGTGNKPELMVGFFTKYGDGGVDLEPLGELHKHEVRGLAQALGVPTKIVERTPSPGLWPGQTDEGEMGITYAEIDAILAAWDAGQEPGLPADRIAKVEGMVARSAHKRAMPPAYPVKRF